MKVLLVLFTTLVSCYFGFVTDIMANVSVLQEKGHTPPDSVLWTSPQDTAKFAHSLHVKVDGTDCAVCHKNESDPIFTVQMCIKCHDEESPKQLKSVPADSVIGFEPSHPIGFSHAVHMQIEGMDCMTCHSKPGEKVDLQVCLTCHRDD